MTPHGQLSRTGTCDLGEILLGGPGLGCRDTGPKIFPQVYSLPSLLGILGGCPIVGSRGWYGQHTPVLRLTPIEEEAHLQRQTLWE